MIRNRCTVVCNLFVLNRNDKKYQKNVVNGGIMVISSLRLSSNRS